MKRLFLMVICISGYLGGMQRESRRLAKRYASQYSQVAVARAGIKSGDAGVRWNAIELFRALVEKGQYYQEALAAAQEGIKDSDIGVRSKAFSLFRALVGKGQCYQEALAAAQEGIKDSSSYVRSAARELESLVLKKSNIAYRCWQTLNKLFGK